MIVKMSQNLKSRKIKVVKDLFAQCEVCNKWERCGPEDEEDGGRFIPLFNMMDKGKMVYACMECFDKGIELEE